MRGRKIGWLIAGGLGVVLLAGNPGHASLSRNAAGPRNMGDEGAFTLDTASELENEEDGRVWMIEAALQYQASARLQILAEAVVFEDQRPDGATGVNGVGDTELTVSWLARQEHGSLPPLVLAAKAKLPTAGDDLGTGQADYSALLLLAKELGELELNVELELATFGSPAGEELNDQFLYTLGAEYGVSDVVAVYAEAFGNSAPVEGESRTDAALVGVEADLFATEARAPYVSLEVDTESTATARAGIEWTW